MFKKLFGKKELGKAFVIGFHVKPMENSIMPPELGGAYVDCFSKGENYEEATKKALDKLNHISEALYIIFNNQVLTADMVAKVIDYVWAAFDCNETEYLEREISYLLENL